jgi:hypothetical protein
MSVRVAVTMIISPGAVSAMQSEFVANNVSKATADASRFVNILSLQCMPPARDICREYDGAESMEGRL